MQTRILGYQQDKRVSRKGRIPSRPCETPDLSFPVGAPSELLGFTV